MTSVVQSTTTAALTDRQKLDLLLDRGGYSEIKGRDLAFALDIETDDSLTHVISTLPEDVLPQSAFHVDAARQTIADVEAYARQKPSFRWNPLVEGGSEAERQYLPKRTGAAKRENFVFLFSSSDPVPRNLASFNSAGSIVQDRLARNRTLFFTIYGGSGDTSYLRWSGPEAYSFAIPVDPPNQPVTVLEQLLDGWNLELWNRTGQVSPFDQDANESLKQAAGQVMTLRQTGRLLGLMDRRFGRPVAAGSSPWAYPPRSQPFDDLYNQLAASPAIR